jgi:hypothetical protein
MSDAFESWHCKHENDQSKGFLFCPPEGCPKHYGCARDHGWKPGDPSPRECQDLPPLSPTPASYAELVARYRTMAQNRWRDLHGGYSIQPDPRAHPNDELVMAILKLADALEALSRESEARGAELDAAYIAIIDTCGFLRGNGDVCEVAANRLIRQVPEDFDEREEAARTVLGAKP